MDRDVYLGMAATERTHWWFVARREIIRSVIERRVCPPPGARILEAGCGTGGNLQMLARYGELDAFELDDDAREWARERTGVNACAGSLPGHLDNVVGPYDMIALFDVLEHLDRDEESLRSLAGLLKPGGRLVLTVPALQALWSDHDVQHHHHRRYSRKQLRAVIERSGLRVDYISYFNFFLLPLAAAQRTISNLRGVTGQRDTQPPRLLNAALERIFRSERAVLRWTSLPIGLSLCAVCYLPANHRRA